MADAVRRPDLPGAGMPTRRPIEDRLFVRWPGAWAALARTVDRLPPQSRLRRVLVRRTVLSGWKAFVRGDLDLILVRYAPDCCLEPPPEWTAAGMRTVYRGHEGWREWAADWFEAWEHMKLTSLEIVDAGNPVVALGEVHQRARGSGIEFDSSYGSVYWAEGGLIVRESHFVDLNETLSAAGIERVAAGDASGVPGTEAGTEPSDIAES
jgi:ketosteroid isomerase-like protein